MDLNSANSQGGQDQQQLQQQQQQQHQQQQHQQQGTKRPAEDPPWKFQAFFVGAVCMNCNGKIQARGSSLWVPSVKVIKQHLERNKCYSCQYHNAMPKEIHASLVSSQAGLHEAFTFADDTNFALKMIQKTFPSFGTNSNSKPPSSEAYCNNCGFTARNDHFPTHFGDNKNVYGCSHATHAGKGPILSGLYGLKCPEAILEGMLNGTFKPPSVKSSNQQAISGSTVSAILPMNLVPQVNIPTDNLPSPNQPITYTSSQPSRPSRSFQPITTATTEQMNRQRQSTIDDVSSMQMHVNVEARTDKALQCFIDPASTTPTEDQLQHARQYLSIFRRYLLFYIPNPSSSGRVFHKLAMSASAKFNSEQQIHHILLEAGKRWLKCSANSDVQCISALLRGQMYTVGNTEAPDEDSLVRGRTFTSSYSMDAVIDEWVHFFGFIICHLPSLIARQIRQAAEIYLSRCRLHVSEPIAREVAIAQIIETNIIYGILIETLIQEPATKKEMTIIDLYLVARSVSASEYKQQVNLRSGSVICE